MSGLGQFPGQPGTTAPEMPPFYRPPAPPEVENRVTEPARFDQSDTRVVQDAISTDTIAEVEQVEVELGPTGRPMPVIPEPRPAVRSTS